MTMNYDEDKINEYTLALLYLVAHERQKDSVRVHGRDLTGRP